MAHQELEARDQSLDYLFARLALVAKRIRLTVAARREQDPNPDDPFRGLYLSHDDLERQGASPVGDAGDGVVSGFNSIEGELEQSAADAEAAGEDVRLLRLARTFRLDHLDVDILLVSLVPDLDRRFEKFYGYLNDDVTQRRPTVGLGIEMLKLAPASPGARARFLAGSPLLDGGLIEIEERGRPFLSRVMRVPDRVASHLLGDDTPDPLLFEVFTSPAPASSADSGVVAEAISRGVSSIYLREERAGSGMALAAKALEDLGKRYFAIDLRRFDFRNKIERSASVLRREAALRGSMVIAGPVDAVPEEAMSSFAEIGWPLILTGRKPWDPVWSRTVPLVIEVPVPTPAQRVALWKGLLNGSGNGFDPDVVTTAFRLGPEEVARATQAAQIIAASAGRKVEASDLRAGARAQNGAGLEKLARRISPSVRWDDLVLPMGVSFQLEELLGRARNREKVLDEWQMRRGSRGEGIAALFAGPSGTGKTIAAEVIAGDLGLDLYTIDLATVVDKYVGETEKNLDRVFQEAEGVNGVLFFDEADALFGKRSEVKDAHDRYANIEVAYLLQRMESFEGLAVLATNLGANIDEAFARRLSMSVDFPMPDSQLRLKLWEKSMASAIPRADDLDLEFCAKAFELSGGNIRNIVLAAAYLAAEDKAPLAMRHLIRGTQREYRKLGRLCVEAEFGRYHHLIVQ